MTKDRGNIGRITRASRETTDTPSFKGTKSEIQNAEFRIQNSKCPERRIGAAHLFAKMTEQS